MKRQGRGQTLTFYFDGRYILLLPFPFLHALRFSAKPSRPHPSDPTDPSNPRPAFPPLAGGRTFLSVLECDNSLSLLQFRVTSIFRREVGTQSSQSPLASAPCLLDFWHNWRLCVRHCPNRSSLASSCASRNAWLRVRRDSTQIIAPCVFIASEGPKVRPKSAHGQRLGESSEKNPKP